MLRALFLLLFSLAPSYAGYAFDRTITFDHTKVSNTDQTDFPNFFTTNFDAINGALGTNATAITLTSGLQVQNGDYIGLPNCDPASSEIFLVNSGGGTTSLGVSPHQLGSSTATHVDKQFVTDCFLASAANGGSVTNANGYDIVFGTDFGCVTRLSWDIIQYKATGTARFRIKQSRSHTADGTAHVCYGNSAITTFQSVTANVYNTNNFVSVWNLSDTSHLTDSLGTNNGTLGGILGNATCPVFPPYAATTQCDPSQGAVIDHYVDVGSDSSLNLTTLTLTAWADAGDGSNPYMVYSKGDGVNKGYEIFVGQGAFTFTFGDGTNLAIDRITNSALNPPGPPPHSLAVTITGNTVLMYVDGVSVAFSNLGAAASGISNTSGSAELGARPTNAFGMFGPYSEVTLSSVVRTADFIKTWDNNERSPYTFYSVSAPTAIPSGVRHRIIA